MSGPTPDARARDRDGTEVPRFVVVGHPNKGKSSIVATLAEDDAVPISPLPGTTTEARRYPLRVDGELLYELVDTPGFQRPRETLAWLTHHRPAAHERSLSVAEFVEAHRDDPRFSDECALLEPVLDCAGVLYVVDGSKPYGPEYEAEMEILRWAGRPRMALVNRIGGADHVEEWRRALDQFFSIVRVFDATGADFESRVALLRALRELSEHWWARIDRAVEVLVADRAHRRVRSAAEIAGLLLDVTGRRVRRRIGADVDAGAQTRVRSELEEGLQRAIRAREDDCRRQIEGIYRHSALTREEQAASLLDLDLFSAESWQVFGLSDAQLVAAGALSGAVAGSGIDAALGGASLLLGAAAGAVVGGVGAWLGNRQLARTRVLGLPLGGRELVVGPVRDANFPWVILGRALRHQRLVSERNHARREALVVPVPPGDPVAGSVQEIAPEVRREIERLLVAARESPVVEPEHRRRLERLLEPLLAT